MALGVVLTNTEEKVCQLLRENMVGGEGMWKESEGAGLVECAVCFPGKGGPESRESEHWILGGGRSLCGESYPSKGISRHLPHCTPSMLNKEPSDD